MTDIELLRKIWPYVSLDAEWGNNLKRHPESSGLPNWELRDEYNRRQGRTDLARLVMASMRDHGEFASKSDER